MSGYFRRFETKDDICVCLGHDNSILSVENLGDFDLKIEHDEYRAFLKPGQKLTFGPNTKFYQGELMFWRISKHDIDDDIDDDDFEADDRGDCYD